MIAYYISEYSGHRFLAVKDDNLVTDLFFPEEGDVKIGNIYLAKVTEISENTGGAFLSLGEEKAYLPLSAAELKAVRPQDELIVQVRKSAVKTKEIRVTRKLSVAGRYLALSSDGNGVSVSKKIRDEERREELRSLPFGRPGEGASDDLPERSAATLSESGGAAGASSGLPAQVVIRTNAQAASNEEILEEYERLSAAFTDILKKGRTRTCYSLLYKAPDFFRTIITDAKCGTPELVMTDLPDVYERLSEDGIGVKLYEDKGIPLIRLYSIQSVIEDSLKKRVWLKSGGYLVIEPTEAMTVVDVNSGKNVQRKEKEEIFLKINLEAAAELARQLRLRNLSGIIIADFINMKNPEHNKKLQQTLSALLSKDPVTAVLVDFTKLGLAEITRTGTRKPLREVLLQRDES